MKQVITDLLDSMNLVWKDSGQDFILCQCMSPDHKDKNPSMFIQTEIAYGRCQGCGFEVFPETFIKDETTLEDHKLLSGYRQIQGKLELEELIEGSDTFYLPQRSDSELMEYRGLTKETIEAAGMYKCDVGRYENRIIIPFKGIKEELRGFTSRWLGDVPNSSFPKYLHSKGMLPGNNVLFADAIKKLDIDPSVLVITEGSHDALHLLQAGIAATPSLGFRVPTDLFVLDCIRLGVDTLVLAWDNDDAGLLHMVGAKSLLPKWNDKYPTKLGFYNSRTAWLYKSKFKDFGEAAETLGPKVFKTVCGV